MAGIPAFRIEAMSLNWLHFSTVFLSMLAHFSGYFFPNVVAKNVCQHSQVYDFLLANDSKEKELCFPGGVC